MIDNIKNNKAFSLLLLFVSVIGILSSLNVKVVSANGNYNSSGESCKANCGGDFYDAGWRDVKGVHRKSIFKTIRGTPWHLESFFQAKGEDIDKFLAAEEQYIFFMKDSSSSDWGIPLGINLGWTDDDSGYDYVLPGKSLTESRRIYDSLSSRERYLALNHPFILYGKFSKPCETRGGACKCAIGETKPSYTRNQNYKNNDKSIAVDYSYRVVITPVKPKGFESLSKEEQEDWKKTHIAQELAPELTEAGKFIRSFNLGEIRGTYNSSEQWDDLVNKLKDLNNKEPYNGNVNLNAQNLKGFQRGGVYTITTYVKQVNVQASSSDIVRVDTSCALTGDNSSDWKTSETVLKKAISDVNLFK